MRDWSEFTGKSGRGHGDACVATITAAGNLNVSAFAWGLMGMPSHCVLLYDAESSVIGLRPATEAIPHAFAMRRNGKTRSVSARRFAEAFGIDHAVARTYPAVLENGLLVIGPITGTDTTGGGDD